MPSRHAKAIGLAAAIAAGILAAAATPARAEGGPLGIGLVIGSPTGVSVKYFLDEDTAIDGAVGGAVIGAAGIQLHADYLWHPIVLASETSFDLGFYLGLGARLLDHDNHPYGDDLHLGARAPFGMAFDFRKTNIPLDAFAEVAFLLDMVFDDDHEDAAHFDVNASIGVRYYF